MGSMNGSVGGEGEEGGEVEEGGLDSTFSPILFLNLLTSSDVRLTQEPKILIFASTAIIPHFTVKS